MDSQSLIGPRKTVTAVVECGANYVFHLLAVSRVGFNSDYADTYGHSVRAEDVTYIKNHADMLTFGGGSGGDLADCFIGLPVYYGLSSKESFEEYYSLLGTGLQTGDFNPFLEHYAHFIDKLRQWAWPEDADLSEFCQYADIVAELGAIVSRNHHAYVSQVWPHELPKLQSVAARVNSFYRQGNHIAKWEDLIKEQFKFNDYQIVLCSALKNGTNANSTGYDQVVFYHDKPFALTAHLICHEIGTHLLFPVYGAVRAMEIFDPATLYAAYECMARFYNMKILDTDALAYNLSAFPEKEYQNIFADLLSRNQDLSPHDLLVAGIKTFQDTRS